jgi:hypothetical protein
MANLMMFWTMPLQTLRSISKKLFRNESGSAVVGFALGAPFVLLIFIGFLDVTHLALKSLISQSQVKVRLQDFAQSSDSPLPRNMTMQHFDEVVLVHEKSSPWNIWRIKE